MAYAPDFDRDLEEQAASLTSCPICMEIFEIPKVLPCQHTFCLGCIEAHYNASNKQRLVAVSNFPCPTCRAVCYVPRNGLANLPTDFKVDQIHELMKAINAISSRSSAPSTTSSPDTSSEPTMSRPNSVFLDGAPCAVCRCLGTDKQASTFCVQCSKHFCTQCSTTHSKNSIFSDHSVLPISPTSTDAGCWKCETHQAEMTYFCVECSKPACMLCVTCSHQGHTVLGQVAALEHVRKRLKECVESLERKRKEFDGKQDVIKRLKQEHEKTYRDAEKNIKKAVREAEQKLKDIEKQLLTDLKSGFDTKSQAISTAEKSFQERHKSAKSLAGQLSDLAGTNNTKTALGSFASLEEKACNELSIICDIAMNLYDGSAFIPDVQVKLGSIERRILASEDRRSQTLLQKDLPKGKSSPTSFGGRLKEGLRSSMRRARTVAGGETGTSVSSNDSDSETGKSSTLRRQALVEKLERRLSMHSGTTPSPGNALDEPGTRFNLFVNNNNNNGTTSSGAASQGTASTAGVVTSGTGGGTGRAAGQIVSTAVSTPAGTRSTTTSGISSGATSNGVNGLARSILGGGASSTTQPLASSSSSPSLSTRTVTTGTTPKPPGSSVTPKQPITTSGMLVSNTPRVSLSPGRVRSGKNTFSAKTLWRFDGFVRCRCCCFTAGGQVAASEYAKSGRDRIKIFSATGQLLHSIESILIAEPWALCYNTVTSSLLITDHGGTASSIKSVKIAAVKDVSSYKCGSTLEKPSGIAFMCNGELVMTETGRRANRVGIYSMMTSGRISRLREFGPKGNGEGEILSANYVAVDHDDRIIVPDYESHHIKVFSSNGQQLLKFSAGGSDGRDMVPQGVAVDEFNNILVADQTARGISKFCCDGQQIGDTIKTCAIPWGISYDIETQRLAVTYDRGLEMFQL